MSDSMRTMYSTNFYSKIYMVNNDGQLVLEKQYDESTIIFDITYDFNNKILYVVNFFTKEVFSVDAVTFVLTHVGNLNEVEIFVYAFKYVTNCIYSGNNDPCFAALGFNSGILHFYNTDFIYKGNINIGTSSVMRMTYDHNESILYFCEQQGEHKFYYLYNGTLTQRGTINTDSIPKPNGEDNPQVQGLEFDHYENIMYVSIGTNVTNGGNPASNSRLCTVDMSTSANDLTVIDQNIVSPDLICSMALVPNQSPPCIHEDMIVDDVSLPIKQINSRNGTKCGDGFVKNICMGQTNKFVCIKKGALQNNTPTEDLLLTKNHPIIINGEEVLPINIINGHTIYEVNYDKSVLVYALSFNDRRSVKIHGVDVMQWKQSDYDEHVQMRNSNYKLHERKN